MYYIYAIQSRKDSRIYIGFTTNLEKRIKEHNKGKTQSTRFYRPWELIHSETSESRLAAREREKKLKSGFGREYLKSLAIAPVAHKDRAAVS